MSQPREIKIDAYYAAYRNLVARRDNFTITGIASSDNIAAVAAREYRLSLVEADARRLAAQLADYVAQLDVEAAESVARQKWCDRQDRENRERAAEAARIANWTAEAERLDWEAGAAEGARNTAAAIAVIESIVDDM